MAFQRLRAGTASIVAPYRRRLLMMRLIAALGSILLVAGCDSGLPTAPTTVQPNPITPSGGSGGPDLIEGMTISAGTTTEGTIAAVAPGCYQLWDATGRCGQFDITPATGGRLLVDVKWTGSSRGVIEPDLFLVTAEGVWAWTGAGWPDKQGTLLVKSGLTYHIVVISYGPFPDTFAVTADVQP
jgi:hypothetical protein